MKNDNLTETFVSSEEIWKGRLLHVFCDTVELPNGKRSTREFIKHNGAVAVVPIDENGDAYMVRQYRHAVGRVTLEIPAGKIDPGEEPLAAAGRELSEETGLLDATYEHIGNLLPSVAYTSEVIYMYIARGFTAGRQHTDPDEFVDVVKIPLADLADMVMSGQIEDSKTQAAILKAYLIENGNK
ncbi:MAG: NUDIX hydrolase [Clostridia bacterium]|nr:NUDIX hydrolase [Clostridia bacterium]